MDEVPSITTGESKRWSLLPAREPFLTGNPFYITLRGARPREQKMDWCVKHMKKISSTFVVVREKNKKAEGYHFHVLAKLKKVPHKGWYKKGVHIYVNRVYSYSQAKYVFTGRERFELSCDDDEESFIESVHLDDIMKNAEKKMIEQVRREAHVKKILHYMSKDLDMPILYVDYQYILRGKTVPLF